MDARLQHLPVLLSRPGTVFFPPCLGRFHVPVEYMPDLLPYLAAYLAALEKDFTGTYAVTPAGSLYVMLRGDRGWGMVKLRRTESYPRIQEPEHLPPGSAGAEDAADAALNGYVLHGRGINGPPLAWRLDEEGVSDAERRLTRSERIADPRQEDDGGMFLQHETLPQHDYRNCPRAQAPEIELVARYNCILLTSALDGLCSDPNEPAFDDDTFIREKLSICLGMQGVQTPDTLDDFSSKQHRVRSNKTGPLINRAKLAQRTAADVQKFLKHHKVMHKGKPVEFKQLHLKEVRLKSKATAQPVLCLHRSPSPASDPTSRACRSM